MLSSKTYVNYRDIRGKLRPLDLIMFKGSDFVSNFIRYLESKSELPEDGVDISAFSHCGLIITSEILDHPDVYPGKIYIWESTMSGLLGEGVPNVEGKSFFGSQLRDFDLLLPAYLASDNSEVAVCSLNSNPFRDNNIEDRFKGIFNLYNNRKYNYNIINLLATIIPFFRKIRGFFQKLFSTRKWLFCSELIAHVYQDLGLFPKTLNPENVTPMDFLGVDSDHEVPKIVKDPIYIRYN